MKKTKIVTTIGPSSKDKIILEDMILNGMDVARFNMKYASLDFCKDVITRIKEIDKELKTNTSILMELEGPLVTTHNFEEGQVFLKQNDKIRIYMDKVLGDKTKFSVSYKNLIDDVKTNTLIKVNGDVELRVLEKKDDSIICEVIKEGIVVNDSKVNVIDTKLNMPFITKKDKKCIEFACEENIDYIGLSMVTNSEDILSVNDLLIEYNNDHIEIITKIEKIEAIDELDEIIKVSDGIIIDRESLGIEVPPERIPSIVRTTINKCHLQSKISVIITEMESDNESIKPTKTEISDIANVIADGVDAVVLTGETTIGKYPVGTVNTMKKILEASEIDVNYNEFIDKAMRTENNDITGTIAYSVVEAAERLRCIAIVIPTMNGYTAKKISRYRPRCPIIALTPNPDTAKSLGMLYGICPILIEDVKSFDMMTKISRNIIDKKFNVTENDKIIITGGYPFKEVKHTNFMKIEEL